LSLQLKVLQFLDSTVKNYCLSITGLKTILQYIILSHYYIQPLSFFCCDNPCREVDNVPESFLRDKLGLLLFEIKQKGLSNEELEDILNNPSSSFKDYVKKSLNTLFKYRHNFYVAVSCYLYLQKLLRGGEYVSKLSEFMAILDPKIFESRLNLISQLRYVTSLKLTQIVECFIKKIEKQAAHTMETELYKFTDLLNRIQKEPNYSKSYQLMEAKSLIDEDTINIQISNYIKEFLRTYLISFTSQPLYKIFYYDNIDKLLRRFNPDLLNISMSPPECE